MFLPPASDKALSINLRRLSNFECDHKSKRCWRSSYLVFPPGNYAPHPADWHQRHSADTPSFVRAMKNRVFLTETLLVQGDLPVVWPQVYLDGIDILPDRSGFRVQSHDLHGPLPEIVVQDRGDTFLDKDRLSNQACKLVAIVRLRNQMTRRLRGGKFLPPTIVRGSSGKTRTPIMCLHREPTLLTHLMFFYFSETCRQRVLIGN